MISRDGIQPAIEAAVEVSSFFWRDRKWWLYLCNCSMVDLKTTTITTLDGSFLYFFTL